MDELNDVQEDGIVFADNQQYEVDGKKCDNAFVKCNSYYDCTSRYTGQWKNMMPHGRGTIILELRYKDVYRGLAFLERYDGMWRNGVICGKGRLIYISFDIASVPGYYLLIEGEFDEKGHSRIGSN